MNTCAGKAKWQELYQWSTDSALIFSHQSVQFITSTGSEYFVYHNNKTTGKSMFILQVITPVQHFIFVWTQRSPTHAPEELACPAKQWQVHSKINHWTNAITLSYFYIIFLYIWKISPYFNYHWNDHAINLADRPFIYHRVRWPFVYCTLRYIQVPVYNHDNIVMIIEYSLTCGSWLHLLLKTAVTVSRMAYNCNCNLPI